MIIHDRPKCIPIIIQGLREGLTEVQACSNAGVPWHTFYDWKREMPGLDERVEAAKKSRIVVLEDALYKAAMKGSVTAIMILMRKESKKWRELLDGEIVPEGGAGRAAALGAVAGASAVLSMLAPEKRKELKLAMAKKGMLRIDGPVIDVSTTNGHANGTNGNGTH